MRRPPLLPLHWSSPVRPRPMRRRPPPAAIRSVAADVNLERVVLQAYRAIGDRHLFEPNFRTLSTETYRGFASADPRHGAGDLRRHLHRQARRPRGAEPADAGRPGRRPRLGRHAGRADGRLARRLAGAAAYRPPDADPRGDDGHHQAARPQQPLRRSRRGARQPLPARRRRRCRHHRRAHRRQEDHDPRRPGRLACGQGRRPGRRPDPVDRRQIDDRPTAERRRGQAARLGRRAGRDHRAARLAGRRIRARA